VSRYADLTRPSNAQCGRLIANFGRRGHTVTVVFNPNLSRSAGSARLLLQLGAERGMSASRCLRGTGLREGDFDEPFAEIAASQELAIVRNLAMSLQEPHLGLVAGARYSIGLFGIYGYACMSAPTLREVIDIALRYQDLAFTLARARTVVHTDWTFIEIGVAHLEPDVRPFVIDHCLATVWKTMTDINGWAPDPMIELQVARPLNDKPYLDMFRSRPRYRMPVDRIGFANVDLDLRRTGVDPAALALCERQCRGLIARRKEQIGTRGLVHERLARAVDRVPTMEAIASDLNMSARSLRRSLAAEGTSFRDIDERVRHDRADELLAEGFSISQVAEQVGYATSSAFVNAYKRWCGTTPGKFTARSGHQVC
jgi:AraC-like DNA-binding protein